MKFKIFLKIFVFLLTLALTIQNNDEDFDIQGITIIIRR